jgi:hypothetical protein
MVRMGYGVLKKLGEMICQNSVNGSSEAQTN